MLNGALIIAHKEIVDHLRDRRSLLSSALYSLMGPFVVALVSLSPNASAADHTGAGPLPGLMSVFALVSAFTGGMALAMDTVAGERERRSLLPLLLNPISRSDVAIGKWLAVAAFSAAGLFLNLLGFTAVWTQSAMPAPSDPPFVLLTLAAGILPLVLLSSALEILISTTCRTTKEAQTYLSLLVFIPMLAGMAIVFFPAGIAPWWRFLPIAGQELQLQSLSVSGTFLQPLILGWTTAAAAVAVVLAAANRLSKDDVVYGN